MGYYVIAHDGKRYGPADVTTLQQWVREGRIAPNTTLEDEFTGTQIRASLLPELSHLFPSTGAPPSDAGIGPPRTVVSAGGPSSRATTALVLGILGILCCQFLAIPAIIIGKAEMNDVDQGMAPVEGRGMAQAGYILGIIGVVLLVLAIVYFLAMMSIGWRSVPEF